jgi:hypothetical protein
MKELARRRGDRRDIRIEAENFFTTEKDPRGIRDGDRGGRYVGRTKAWNFALAELVESRPLLCKQACEGWPFGL